MAKIILKFNSHFHGTILHGKKNCTSRKRIKGNVGDVFDVCEQLYRITHILETTLDVVAYELYGAEGFASTQDFINFWTQNIRPFDPEEVVYCHFFAAVIQVTATKDEFITAAKMQVQA